MIAISAYEKKIDTGPDFAVITPTYSGHFKYLAAYLRTFDQYVADKAAVPLYFIINREEERDFHKLIAPYTDALDIHVLCFETILAHFEIQETPEELLRVFGKFSFQTLKKFYAMLYVGKARYLVLDSESCWVRETNMAELFRAFFADPFIAWSDRWLFREEGSVKEEACRQAEHLLGAPVERWYIENFCWFYELRILRDLFREAGSPIELARKARRFQEEEGLSTGIFEIILYCAYLDQNNGRYGYRFLDMYESFKRCLGSELFDRYVKARASRGGETGFSETFMRHLTKENTGLLARLYRDDGIRVVRCQTESVSRIGPQKRFLREADINILAASQEHVFLPNRLKRVLAVIKRECWSLCKHAAKRAAPSLYEKLWQLKEDYKQIQEDRGR